MWLFGATRGHDLHVNPVTTARDPCERNFAYRSGGYWRGISLQRPNLAHLHLAIEQTRAADSLPTTLRPD